MKGLSSKEIGTAKLVRASTTAYKKGFEVAQAELDSSPKTRGWKVDTKLSSAEGLVLTKGQEIKVAVGEGKGDYEMKQATWLRETL